ncbi:elongation factor 1-beta-like [Mytilus galloprovincialis]|uniref:Elongation factor 1-beta n=1 Tax=Mytilus galloprovincialis TaxID=29158 RepID=A0A8B6H785_MYTGA|nr:elongation factor 1-beta [Mytilus galloprovincialis]
MNIWIFPVFSARQTGDHVVKNIRGKKDMGFGDLKAKAGQQALNAYLADKSYIEGYQASQADAVVFAGLTGAPSKDLVNALRWYNQINSYNNQERTSFPGTKKDINSYGSAAPAASNGDADEDDFDLFGSDDEEEVEKEKQKRLQQYAEKKAKKPALIAKSSIVLDVKPWDDETDMEAMEKLVRTVETDGLIWGKGKLVPVGYGIKKLQIGCVVEDDKVGTDFLEEAITAFEDYVQSVDIAAFNKI